MHRLRRWWAPGLLIAGLFFCTAARAAPEVGWYWNPAESGRGFFVESQNGVTFIGAYLYDTDGHALWLVAGGPNDDPYNFTGPLYYKTGGQTLYGSYVAPGAAVIAGNITVHFTDDTHATVTWPGGSVSIQRQVFGSGEADFPAFSGWWWNADESGRGYSLELQGDKLFIVGFMYDDAGRPVWYYTAGSMTDSVTYHGDVYQFADGQTMGGPYKPPGAPTKIATLDLEFNADNEADVTFTEATTARPGHAKAKSTNNHWTPQFDKHGHYVYPGGYAGLMTFNVAVDLTATKETWEYDIANAVLEPTLPPAGGPPQTSRHYHVRALNGGDVTATVKGTLADCTAAGTGDFPLISTSLDLEITQDAKYTVTFDFSNIILNVILTCPNPPTTTPVALPAVSAKLTLPSHAINNKGLLSQHSAGMISRTWGPLAPAAGVSVDGDYQFAPTP